MFYFLTKSTSQERRLVMFICLIVPSFSKSLLLFFPKISHSELLLYIMKKVELFVCFLILYCSRNGAVLLGTQKAMEGGLCVPSPLPSSFFRNHLRFLARRFWCETFCETPLSLPSLGFVTLFRSLAKFCPNSRRAKWFLLHPRNFG